jgi:tagatose-6-phosphate ketose/aldose isomerase
VNALERLINLREQEKEALGIVATPREIAQQPETWKTTLLVFERHRQALQSFLEAAGFAATSQRKPSVVMIGAGTSDYIGRVLTLLLRKKWGCETQAIPSTDMLLNMDDYFVGGQPYLCISFSRSGDSPEGVGVLQKTLEKFPSVIHLIVTCNQRGRMAELCRDHDKAYAVVLDDAVNDRGLAMTSSFSNMVIFGQCLAHLWTPDDYLPIFQQLIAAGESLLRTAPDCAESLASRGYERVCVLGSGSLTGVARESALKVLEMTAGRVKTMAESVLGLRHGPMAALDRQTLLACFASSDNRTQRYEADLLHEVAAKGIVAEVLVVGPAGAEPQIARAERYLPIEGEIPDLYRPPVDVITGQLLGLFFSLAHGLQPDKPSPGEVISRVVGQFTIYE